jgi:hypothetical protein
MRLVVSHCRRQTHTKMRSVHTLNCRLCGQSTPATRVSPSRRGHLHPRPNSEMAWCVQSAESWGRCPPPSRSPPISPLLTNITLAIGHSAFAAAMLAYEESV